MANIKHRSYQEGVPTKIRDLLQDGESSVAVYEEGTREAVVHTPVAISQSSVPILAENLQRRGVILENLSTQELRIKYGTVAAANSFTARIPAGEGWEMPTPIYRGVIHGIWMGADATPGNGAYPTELL